MNHHLGDFIFRVPFCKSSEISTTRNDFFDVILRTLAERHSDNEITKVVIQTSPGWKNDLASEAISLYKDGFDFKEKGMSHVKSLDAFKDE